MKYDVIIQSRMGSTRLPGKILLPLSDKSVLEHVVERASLSENVSDVIIATTISSADDVIEELCVDKGYKFYRGSESDVLARYYNSAKSYNSDVIIRVTSDCPLIDPNIIDEMISLYEKSDSEFVVNVGRELKYRTFPRGLDVEMFSFRLLEKAYNDAKLDLQREHVTPYIYENYNNICYYLNDIDYSKYRITLDTEADYQLISAMYKDLYLGKHDFFKDDIIKWLEGNKEISLMNQHIIQKSVLSLRNITQDDCKLIFEWANDYLVRENAFSSSKIDYEEHKKWYQNVMLSKNIFLYVAEIGTRAIGQIRFDIRDEEVYITYSIDEKYRGQGYGKHLVFQGVEKFKRECSCKYPFVAKVKENNLPSVRIFEILGFDKIKEGEITIFRK